MTTDQFRSTRARAPPPCPCLNEIDPGPARSGWEQPTPEPGGTGPSHQGTGADRLTSGRRARRCRTEKQLLVASPTATRLAASLAPPLLFATVLMRLLHAGRCASVHRERRHAAPGAGRAASARSSPSGTTVGCSCCRWSPTVEADRHHGQPAPRRRDRHPPPRRLGRAKRCAARRRAAPSAGAPASGRLPIATAATSPSLPAWAARPAPRRQARRCTHLAKAVGGPFSPNGVRGHACTRDTARLGSADDSRCPSRACIVSQVGEPLAVPPHASAGQLEDCRSRARAPPRHALTQVVESAATA